MRQLIRDNAALRRLYYRLKVLRSRGQSDESHILSVLARHAARTFIEFGFHPIEFNCAALARNADWRGLLIDGSSRRVEDARAILPSRVEVVETFLALHNLDLIRTKFTQLGVLSIDVDGNDYWFLKALIDINPTVICVEYDASFGLEPISVPTIRHSTATKSIRVAGIMALRLLRWPNYALQTAMDLQRFLTPVQTRPSRGPGNSTP
jgi:hypothetical protein